VLGSLAHVPFVDLPSLGGVELLRGYPVGRFRGRVTLLASAEYRYPIQPSIAAHVFVDAGRAYAEWSDLSWRSLTALRVGFGAGLQVYTQEATRFIADIATSIDGGIQLNLIFGLDEPALVYR
jgi:outer membrane protein assembly factor BamA